MTTKKNTSWKKITCLDCGGTGRVPVVHGEWADCPSCENGIAEIESTTDYDE